MLAKALKSSISKTAPAIRQVQAKRTVLTEKGQERKDLKTLGGA
jgi:flagellar biosynthesis chaperone FliJ